MPIIISALLLALAFGCKAAAQSASTSATGATAVSVGLYEQAASHQADLSHGSVIAAQGTPNGVPACAQCHAFDGAADGSGAFPRIAGLSAYYFEKQMRDFASGVRDNAIMSPLTKPLSADDIADVAAYYAGAKAPFPPLAGPAPALIARGEKLATMGDAPKGIPGCNICHGPRGAGETTPLPRWAVRAIHRL